jgi:hypothetical protein
VSLAAPHRRFETELLPGCWVSRLNQTPLTKSTEPIGAPGVLFWSLESERPSITSTKASNLVGNLLKRLACGAIKRHMPEGR